MPQCKPISIIGRIVDHYIEYDPNNYKAKLQEMNDDQLYEECKRTAWFSAYANSNPKSDYHFMCDLCYEECITRNKPELFQKAKRTV
jgi:hypothetical protein